MANASTWMSLGAAVGLLALAPAGASAELLRCTGRDGKTIFTNDKSQCPGAETYKPKAVLHGTESQPAAPAPSPGTRSSRALRHDQAESTEVGEAARWQQKKLDKENELSEVTARRKYLKEYAAYCNRGGHVLKRDDAGIAQDVKCNELNDKLAELDTQAQEIRTYLDEGLAEECRQAGCEPGWIR